MSVLVAAAKRSTQFDQDEFEDLKEYLLNLQTVLIEGFTTIIQTIDDCNEKIKEIVGSFLEDIIAFLQGCSLPEFSPNLDRIADIVGVLGDIAAKLD